MPYEEQTVLVFGATGQQGGSVATALLKAGWPVRALVRDPGSAKAQALAKAGVELVRGDLADTQSIRAAMNGVYGVFSVQPSSGQGALYGVSDEEEVLFGTTIADLAVESGVSHLIYSSVDVRDGEPTGMGHFDSKLRIEQHIRSLPIPTTIVRPAAFMDMLVMPGFGLETGSFTFLTHPDQPVQLLAVEDIGAFVAPIFADPVRFAGKTIALASDTVTGNEIAAAFSDAAGKPITYARFEDAVLAGNPFLGKLANLMDSGIITGSADLAQLRQLHPDMKMFRSWLAGSGREAFAGALASTATWQYGHG